MDPILNHSSRNEMQSISFLEWKIKKMSQCHLSNEVILSVHVGTNVHKSLEIYAEELLFIL